MIKASHDSILLGLGPRWSTLGQEPLFHDAWLSGYLVRPFCYQFLKNVYKRDYKKDPTWNYHWTILILRYIYQFYESLHNPLWHHCSATYDCKEHHVTSFDIDWKVSFLKLDACTIKDEELVGWFLKSWQEILWLWRCMMPLILPILLYNLL